MAAHDHWIPFYVGDYLADTSHLTTVQHGAYLLLLFHFVRTRKPIPDEAAVLAQVARMTLDDWARNSTVVLAFWTLTKDGWVQKRAAAESQRAEKIYKKRVEAGRKSASRRMRLARSPSTQHQRAASNAPTNPDDTPQTTTPTKGVYENQAPFVSSAGPVGVASAPTSRPRTTVDPETVIVAVPSGAKLSIDRHGNFDEVWAPRDCPQTRMTRDQALELRQQELTRNAI
ncbi:MAG: DUF1376 domain-containing protein [Proteobacteria bacterium]|nr:DUF1376 domain-containing protein [Pseudomonadota bacterium]